MTIQELKEVAKSDPRIDGLLRAVFIEALNAFIEDMKGRVARLNGVELKKVDFTAFRAALRALRGACHERNIRHLPVLTPSLVAREL